jgi:dCTP deaminase
MILADTDIKQGVTNGDITISDFDSSRVQPASYDILLGNNFILNDTHTLEAIDPANKVLPETREVEVADGDKFVLHPGVSVLGVSDDYFGSEQYLIQLSGKSSLARIGLIVHNTAGIVNPGHYLHITLELYNLNNVPIILRPKMAIAQLTFHQLTSQPEQSYKTVGRYSEENWKGWTAPKQDGVSN